MQRRKITPGMRDAKFRAVLNDSALVRLTKPLLRRKGNHSVVMLDIDNFKSFNEARGHFMGNQVLGLYAGTIAQVARKYNGYASRFGGEEFRIYLPVGAKQTERIIAELNMQLRQKFIADRKRFSKISFPTFSAGVADVEALRSVLGVEKRRREIYDKRGYKIRKFSEVIKKPLKRNLYANIAEAADRALYYSKHAGRNRATLFNEATLSDRVVGAPLTPENVHTITAETRKDAQKKMPLAKGKTPAKAAMRMNRRIFSLGLINELGLRTYQQKVAFERLLFRRSSYAMADIARQLVKSHTKAGALRELDKAEKILNHRKVEIDTYKNKPGARELNLRAFNPFFDKAVRNIQNARKLVIRLRAK